MHYLLVYCQSICKYSPIHPHLTSSFSFSVQICSSVGVWHLLSFSVTTVVAFYFFMLPDQGHFEYFFLPHSATDPCTKTRTSTCWMHRSPTWTSWRRKRSLRSGCPNREPFMRRRGGRVEFRLGVKVVWLTDVSSSQGRSGNYHVVKSPFFGVFLHYRAEGPMVFVITAVAVPPQWAGGADLTFPLLVFANQRHILIDEVFWKLHKQSHEMFVRHHRLLKRATPNHPYVGIETIAAPPSSLEIHSLDSMGIGSCRSWLSQKTRKQPLPVDAMVAESENRKWLWV